MFITKPSRADRIQDQLNEAAAFKAEIQSHPTLTEADRNRLLSRSNAVLVNLRKVKTEEIYYLHERTEALKNINSMDVARKETYFYRRCKSRFNRKRVDRNNAELASRMGER